MSTQLFNGNTSQSTNFGPEDQQRTVRILRTLAPWLLALCSLEGTFAVPELCREITAPVASLWGLSRASAPPPTVGALQLPTDPTNAPGTPWSNSSPPKFLSKSVLQLHPDSPPPPWSNSIASTLARASQPCMSQEAAPDQQHNLPRTSPKVTSVNEHFSFQARGGEQVRFFFQKGQWQAQVSSRIGSASCRAVLPLVCSQGEDVASSLEFLSKYPSRYSQRQIHVLDENVCPTLGAVVFVGRIGLRGGGNRPSCPYHKYVRVAEDSDSERECDGQSVQLHLDTPLVIELALMLVSKEELSSVVDSDADLKENMNDALYQIERKRLLDQFKNWDDVTDQDYDNIEDFVEVETLSDLDPAYFGELVDRLFRGSERDRWISELKPIVAGKLTDRLDMRGVIFFSTDEGYWVAYSSKNTIACFVRADRHMQLSINDLKFGTWSENFCKACRSYCVGFTTPEQEVTQARAQRRKEREERLQREAAQKALAKK